MIICSEGQHAIRNLDEDGLWTTTPLEEIEASSAQVEEGDNNPITLTLTLTVILTLTLILTLTRWRRETRPITACAASPAASPHRLLARPVRLTPTTTLALAVSLTLTSSLTLCLP